MTSPLRVLRQIVAPNGRHRKPPLLPDEPIPPQTEHVPHEVLDEDTHTTTPAKDAG